MIIAICVITETPLPSWTMSYGDLESSSVQIYWDELPMNMDSVENMAIMITEPSRDLFVFVGVDKWQRNIHITRLSTNRVYVFKVVAFTSQNASNITYSSQNLTVRTQPGGKFFVYFIIVEMFSRHCCCYLYCLTRLLHYLHMYFAVDQ